MSYLSKWENQTSAKRVLITGGAGFIGSHFTEFLNDLNIDVLVLDNLSTGSLENLPLSIVENDFIFGDVADPELLSSIIKECSIVIHFASVVGMKAVIKNPTGVIDTNINAVKKLAELCSQNSIPLICISSSAVYGGNAHSHVFIKETDPVHALGLHPASLYEESKLVAESICEIYRQTNGLKYIIVRPFNLIGPRQTSSYGMVVPTFIKAAINGTKLPIHGDGTQSRTFSDVRLAVKLLWRLIQNEDCYNKIFNLATTEQEISILNLADMICRLTGENVEYKFVPYEDDFGINYKDIQKRSPNLDKLKAYTGSWTFTSLGDTLIDIIEYERQRLTELLILDKV